MKDLRTLDVSWNAPLALVRSDAHLFAGLQHFENLTVRAWDICIRDEMQVQLINVMQTRFLFLHDHFSLPSGVCTMVCQASWGPPPLGGGLRAVCKLRLGVS